MNQETIMSQPPVDDEYANAVKLPDGSLHQFTLRVGGKAFRCACGCNVFHKPNKENLDLFECNGCGEQYA